ncbi:NERD domain-containing protein [Salimicrobium jeotgali]|uniref:NERD domain-containing protein n=1 Tax=Salimicrobium jeotgali TaxID=1230341 RepID=UPI0011AF9884|nr:NERD domain-containing protein [Salimicrobium jeotgali]
MAQLIKLQDYISRYESNIFHYTGEFIQMKKKNWEGLNKAWKNGGLYEEQEEAVSDESGLLKRIWNRVRNREEEVWEEQEVQPEIPADEEELKIQFLNQLLHFQLKWASTTLQEKSFVDWGYERDDLLKYYLQRFPDTFLLMYEPLVEMKRAVLELDQILIGPDRIDIIVHLDVEEGTIIHPEEGRSWILEESGVRRKIPNPILRLRRSETYVRSVLQTYNHTFPYRKIVLAPGAVFQETVPPYSTEYIGKAEHDDWMNKKRMLKMPLKHSQLKAAQLLMKHARVTSVKAPEWEESE